MEPLDFGNLPEDALVLVDSAPIIYFLEGHTKFGPRFKPLFEAHGAGRLRFAVTTITVAEVLTGPLQARDDALAQRYRAILESWQPIALDIDIAESAARAAGVAPPQAGRRCSSGQRIGDQRGRPGDA
ncbi:putative nucleic acid-binding protein [Bradyrhizobium sp. LB1.3]